MDNKSDCSFCGFPLSGDYDEIKIILKNKRENRRADSKILDNSRHYKFDIENPGILKDGPFTTKLDGLRYDCLIKRHESKKLYVFLHGGRWISSEKLADIPSFSKWQYYPILDGNMLCIEDPMYHDFENLTTGWFYGTPERNYRESTAKLIVKIAELMDVEHNDIIIFSSRAGTSASIQVGSFIRDCTVVAIDPVIDIEKTNESSGFEAITGISLSKKDKSCRNNLTDLILGSKSTRFVILCNVLSKNIYEKQIVPLCDAAGITPNMGFNSINDAVLWLYEAPGAPNPEGSSDNEELFRMIMYTVNEIKNNSEGDNTLLCDMVNSIWYSYYSQKRTIHELKKH